MSSTGNGNWKIAIVGAASLRGKELSEVLGESVFADASFTLLDDEEALGQLEAVADEVTFIQRIEYSAFAGMDFVFFTCDPAVTRKHWKAAQKAGASVIDISGALEGEPDVLVLAPWVSDAGEGAALHLATPAVVTAHTAAIALSLLIKQLNELAPIRSTSATVLEPASEASRAAMDELHQQTVSLLSFQSLPRAIYDAQVAFNLIPVFGEQSKVNLGVIEQRISDHCRLLLGPTLPQPAIQLISAPVFHGYTFSIYVEFAKPIQLDTVDAALEGEFVDVVLGDQDLPSNLTASGQSEIVVRIRSGRTSASEPGKVDAIWIWAALDNLKFSALNAIACAQQLRRLRPQGKVQ
jgi:aspartate-semialdehyde dehydrogenase